MSRSPCSRQNGFVRLSPINRACRETLKTLSTSRYSRPSPLKQLISWLSDLHRSDRQLVPCGEGRGTPVRPGFARRSARRRCCSASLRSHRRCSSSTTCETPALITSSANSRSRLPRTSRRSGEERRCFNPFSGFCFRARQIYRRKTSLRVADFVIANSEKA